MFFLRNASILQNHESFSLQSVTPYQFTLWLWYIMVYITVGCLLPCCAGSIIRWEQQVRFRHMTTRQYLCITADKRVTITPDCRDPRTVFRLHPVIKVRTQSQSVVKHLSNFTLSHCCEMEMILALYGFNFHLHFDFICTHTFLCCLTTTVIKQLNSIL